MGDQALIETKRLTLRRATLADASFILELVNEPGWKRFIGDKNVHTLADAKAYIKKSLLALYAQYGFGLYVVELKQPNTAIGLSGLVKRDTLAIPDLGFAQLAGCAGKGYALEAAQAVLNYEYSRSEYPLIAAITNPDNESSIRLLNKLNFQFVKFLPPDDEGLSLRYFERAADQRAHQES